MCDWSGSGHHRLPIWRHPGWGIVKSGVSPRQGTLEPRRRLASYRSGRPRRPVSDRRDGTPPRLFWRRTSSSRSLEKIVSPASQSAMRLEVVRTEHGNTLAPTDVQVTNRLGHAVATLPLLAACDPANDVGRPCARKPTNLQDSRGSDAFVRAGLSSPGRRVSREGRSNPPAEHELAAYRYESRRAVPR